MLQLKLERKRKALHQKLNQYTLSSTVQPYLPQEIPSSFCYDDFLNNWPICEVRSVKHVQSILSMCPSGQRSWKLAVWWGSTRWPRLFPLSCCPTTSTVAAKKVTSSCTLVWSDIVHKDATWSTLKADTFALNRIHLLFDFSYDKILLAVLETCCFHTSTIRSHCACSCDKRLLLQSSWGDRQKSVNDQCDKAAAWAGDKESGELCSCQHSQFSSTFCPEKLQSS